jgi:putative endonuclease
MGLWAETLATLQLRLTGHSIIARRCKTGLGEIDIIAQRGQTLVFAEVKQRLRANDLDDCITDQQARRLSRAVDHWLHQRPHLGSMTVSFDAIFVAPWSWPRRHRNYFQPLVR